MWLLLHPSEGQPFLLVRLFYNTFKFSFRPFKISSRTEHYLIRQIPLKIVKKTTNHAHLRPVNWYVTADCFLCVVFLSRQNAGFLSYHHAGICSFRFLFFVFLSFDDKLKDN